ncbi:MAG: polysaccharide deacetylase family protein [Turicibacter sp.]
MNNLSYVFPQGKTNVLTFSYDDGVLQDKKLVEIFNQYQLKATFNLNSGLHEEPFCFEMDGLKICRLPLDEVTCLYEGHEVAVHSLTHPPLHELSDDKILKELSVDKAQLESWYGYKMTGMAFPFGNYDERVLNIMQAVGLKYGRSVLDTKSFDVPDSFTLWNPTCHHNDPDMLNLVHEFLNVETEELKLFYIWGHSYEFDIDQNWDTFERLCQQLAHHESVWYATNREILDYMTAIKQLEVRGNELYNPTEIELWVKFKGHLVVINPKEIKSLTN